MSLVLNTNVASLLAQRRLDISSANLKKSMERIASGYRINRSADDAAGLTISQNLTSQIIRMKQASRNTNDGVSLLQVVEGSLAVTTDNLQRIRELTVQAANDTYSSNERTAITTEIRQLVDDIDRIINATQFNGLTLLTGTFSGFGTAPIQVGPNANVFTDVVDLYRGLTDARPQALGLYGIESTPGFDSIEPPGLFPIDLTDHDTAVAFLSDVDRALQRVGLQRGTIGALQNKLESVSSNLDMAIENFSTSNSRIRDIDIASETAVMVQSQILTEAATTVLSQTNQLPRMILTLLQR